MSRTLSGVFSLLLLVCSGCTSSSPHHHTTAHIPHSAPLGSTIDRSALRPLFRALERLELSEPSFHATKIGAFEYLLTRRPGDVTPVITRSHAGKVEVVVDPHSLPNVPPDSALTRFLPSHSGRQVAFSLHTLPTTLFISTPGGQALTRFEVGDISSLLWLDDHALLTVVRDRSVPRFVDVLSPPSTSTPRRVFEGAPDGVVRLARGYTPRSSLVVAETPRDASLWVIDSSTETPPSLISTFPALHHVMARSFGDLALVAGLRPSGDAALYRCSGEGACHVLPPPDIQTPINGVALTPQGVTLRVWGEREESLLFFPPDLDAKREIVSFIGSIDTVTSPVGERELVQVRLSSPITPDAVLSFDAESGVEQGRTTASIDPSSGFEPGRYQAHRFTALSRDGTAVPVSLFRAREPRKRVLLNVYGAYGESLEPRYTPFHALLLSRGVDVGFAHVRGGGERGPSWGETTLRGEKRRAIEDLRAAVLNLRTLGYDDVALAGRSAGGTLAARLAGEEPALVSRVVLEVPFLNVEESLRRHATPRETLEWGDPTKPDQAEKIRGFDPAALSGPFPPLFITAHEHDTVVPPSDVLDFFLRLTKLSGDASPHEFRYYEGASHEAFDDTTSARWADAAKARFLGIVD